MTDFAVEESGSEIRLLAQRHTASIVEYRLGPRFH